MAEYSGIDLTVFFNTVDISGQGRKISISEEAGEPEQYDVTHKGDSEKQTQEGLAEAPTTKADFSCLDESGGSAALLDFAINAKDTLLIYPEGKTHTKVELTLTNARLISRSQPVEYNAPVELEASFSAFNSMTRGTYSSA